MPGLVGAVGVQPEGQLFCIKLHCDVAGIHCHAELPVEHGSSGGGVTAALIGLTHTSQSKVVLPVSAVMIMLQRPWNVCGDSGDQTRHSAEAL